jgi:hypothetical protein
LDVNRLSSLRSLRDPAEREEIGLFLNIPIGFGTKMCPASTGVHSVALFLFFSQRFLKERAHVKERLAAFSAFFM